MAAAVTNAAKAPESETPPKPVQRWSASDYARNGRFVHELAGPIFAMLGPRPGERILDLGCGDGTLTAEIKAAGASVLGVDLSDELLAVARMKGLAVRKLDGHALDFAPEFDAVFSNAALHWMRAPQLVIAGVAQALKPEDLRQVFLRPVPRARAQRGCPGSACPLASVALRQTRRLDRRPCEAQVHCAAQRVKLADISAATPMPQSWLRRACLGSAPER